MNDKEFDSYFKHTQDMPKKEQNELFSPASIDSPEQFFHQTEEIERDKLSKKGRKGLKNTSDPRRRSAYRTYCYNKCGSRFLNVDQMKQHWEKDGCTKDQPVKASTQIFEQLPNLRTDRDFSVENLDIKFKLSKKQLKKFDVEFHDLIRIMNDSENSDQLVTLIDLILSTTRNYGYNIDELLPIMNKFHIDEYSSNHTNSKEGISNEI